MSFTVALSDQGTKSEREAAFKVSESSEKELLATQFYLKQQLLGFGKDMLLATGVLGNDNVEGREKGLIQQNQMRC